MVDQIRLTDGDETRLTFLYDNVTKSISQKGFTYYTFACEEGRYSCNNHCVRQIQQAWPGKGGGMRLQRLSATAYKITDVEMGEAGGLKMKEWNNNTSSFEDIEFDLDGLAEAAPAAKPPPKAPQAASEPRTRDNADPDGLDMEDVSNLQFLCLRQTMRNWRTAAAEAEVGQMSGDEAGAIERAAVSLYIDCRKMGIVGMPQLQDDDDAGAPAGAEPPLPQEPPPHDDDDLPF
tara:strand:- start:1660 stop:2358 length:699 start_codon:yes stop_codon:yes gene_type:complete